VTGASAGIGRATARRLARGGADVALVARRESRLEDLAGRLEADFGVDALVAPTDVRDADAVAEAVAGTVDAFGGLDLLVSNAGVSGGGYDRLEELSLEDFRTLTETNVFGAFYATRAALPHLRESSGNLVFVGSSAGKLPRPGAPVYAASKWWTRGFALSVEAHAGEDGVAVTLVNPTAVRTRLWADELDEGEAAEPEEVAEVIAFAARQAPQTTLSEVDLFRRDLLGTFVPADLDLEVTYDLDDVA